MDIKLTYVPSKRGKKWKTANELKVELSDKSVLIIPENFETDLSTVPKILWGVFPPFGNFLIAPLVHDYLYVIKDKRGRKFADKEMLRLSNLHNSNKIDNFSRFVAVRLFGWMYWNDVIK